MKRLTCSALLVLLSLPAFSRDVGEIVVGGEGRVSLIRLDPATGRPTIIPPDTVTTTTQFITVGGRALCEVETVDADARVVDASCPACDELRERREITHSLISYDKDGSPQGVVVFYRGGEVEFLRLERPATK